MVRTAPLFFWICVTLLACALAAGCSDNVDLDEGHLGFSPETELTSGPVESDTTTFRVHFYWTGYDKDGEVLRFRFAVDADTAQPISQWRATTAKDTILAFPVDPVTAVRPHVFMIAAEDNDGRLDPTPARRFFASSTIPPTSCVVRGPALHTVVPASFTFEWTGYDPDGGADGGGAPVDRFEYLLLRPGTSTEFSGQPLPPYHPSTYSSLLHSSAADSLPAPYGDWKWIKTRELSRRFENITPGEYVFALRASDEAGALERDLDEPCNIRHFYVSSRISGPVLTVCTSLVPNCLFTQTVTDIDRVPLEALEGVSVSFSWSASADGYGGTIAGYSYALDDTSQLGALDPVQSAVTFQPSQLPAGLHLVYVRAVDDGGAITNAVIPLLILEPAFRDPAHGRQVLYVDDSAAPGVESPAQDAVTTIGNFPNDVVETDWWTTRLLSQLGVPVTEWDALQAGYGELQRKPPPLRILANYSTVVWSVDFNNSITHPTALWRTLQGDNDWALRNYLRAGGTLILTGFDASSNTVNPTTLLDALTTGICGTYGPGEPLYARAYVPRLIMGVDDAIPSKDFRRTQGARDFIAAYPTAQGSSMGLDSARIDRGGTGSGAKWITEAPGDPNVNSSPGLGRVDGWVLATSFGCFPDGSLRTENAAEPIAMPILLYHGVNMGVDEEGGPSPREGLVVGIRVQAHSEDPDGGPAIVPGNAQGVLGRTVHFSFPFFWLRDEDAIQAMQAAFQYVNASPTLP